MEGFQIRGVVVLGKDEPFVFINKSGDAAGILFYIPEMGVIQPQQSTY